MITLFAAENILNGIVIGPIIEINFLYTLQISIVF